MFQKKLVQEIKPRIIDNNFLKIVQLKKQCRKNKI